MCTLFNVEIFQSPYTALIPLLWSLYNISTGIPRFTLLMWGQKNKTAEAKIV